MTQFNDPGTTLIIYPPPEGEPVSDDYLVQVAGVLVFVYRARVSAVPFNQVWPGYQRPLDQTELASFVYWDMGAPVQVEVISKRPVSSVIIRPYSLGINPTVQGNRITFTLPRATHLTVEVNGTHQALHIFANPLTEDVPALDNSNLRYFGPGIHRVGKIKLESDQIVYIAGGAVVHGVIEATDATNIKILGRGILDASTFERSEAKGCISLHGCSKVKIKGIILRDPNVWTVIPVNCEYVEISNIKLIGLWRYNADGIDVVNSRHVTITRCFIRSFDDSIVIKGLKKWGNYVTGEGPVSDVQVSDCVIWNDWGRALEIGAETAAPAIEAVRFTDCDIIHCVHIAMDVQNSDRATVKNIRYENIRIEMDDDAPTPRFQTEPLEIFRVDEEAAYCPALLVLEILETMWSQGHERGRIDGVVLKDIRVTAPQTPPSRLSGYDPAHTVENVRIDNLRINGKAITSVEEGRIILSNDVKNVEVQ